MSAVEYPYAVDRRELADRNLSLKDGMTKADTQEIRVCLVGVKQSF